ncbi:MAG: DMT family transporter [Geobacter sp.]|nr:DMT family transporter [Geobacter sp.]
MKRYFAALLLIATTFFWGITFTVVKDAVARVDMLVFLSQRFILAALLMIIPGLLFRGKPDRSTIRAGMILGVALFSAYAFQTAALLYTTASNTAFLTGLNVVFVPLIAAALMGQRVSGAVCLGAGLAAAGRFLLCTGGQFAVNRGDLLGFICSIATAAHIILTGRYAARHDVYWITATQLTTIAVASTIGATLTGQDFTVYHPFLLVPVIICALFATVFAFLVQTAMQRHIPASQTALIFCLEPVFGAGYAYFAAGEKLTLTALSGAVLILAGMLLAELLPSGEHGKLTELEMER